MCITHDKYNDFLLGFKQVVYVIARNPLFVHVIDDLNARAANWWKNDMTTNEGTKIDSPTTSYSLFVVRLFLTQLKFFQILFRALGSFLQNNLT